MLKTQEFTPQVYYKQSRDFQLFGRVYDVVFNYLKYNIDSIYNNPLSDNSALSLVDLLCTTLGFKKTHNYTASELKAICTIFPLIIRNKGNIQSIQITVDTLCRLYGIEGNTKVYKNVNDKNQIDIFLPSANIDDTLLNDILDYILPAGLTVNIIKSTLVENEYNTDIIVENSYKTYQHTDDINGVSAIIPQYSKDIINPSNMTTNGINNSIVLKTYTSPKTTTNKAKVKKQRSKVTNE